ncbi:MAG: hypothetical protein P9L92_03620 [Candidatus Electryonea clarkiae]|nr:hypothetical protein [Candidatus Electryonea clarkiae]MDP8286116.1 hypothetical protein [Candidatus Electryonea clarkiae]
MLKIDEIKASIGKLPKDELIQLRRWISEQEWQIWDEEIEADSEVGKLDFLIQEAKSDKHNGNLEDL